MNPAKIIQNASEEGVSIAVSPTGKIKAIGNEVSLTKWAPRIRKSKTEILCVLHQEEELRRLVRLVSDHHNFSQEDYEEALEVALGDPINALTCFTSLAQQSNLLEKEKK